MLPRSMCLRCRRPFAVNRDGTMRSHFCPHYHTCESRTCGECAAMLERGVGPETETTLVPRRDREMPLRTT